MRTQPTLYSTLLKSAVADCEKGKYRSAITNIARMEIPIYFYDALDLWLRIGKQRQLTPAIKSDVESMISMIERDFSNTGVTLVEPAASAVRSDNNNDLVFISYAREDASQAERLFYDLKFKGYNVWIDRVCLKAGENWEFAIHQSMEKARFILLVLSENSISKIGFVQKEVKEALKYLELYPANEVFIIPVRIEQCKPLEPQLKYIHWVDMFPNWNLGLSQLVSSMPMPRDVKAVNQENSSLREFEGTTWISHSMQPLDDSWHFFEIRNDGEVAYSSWHHRWRWYMDVATDERGLNKSHKEAEQMIEPFDMGKWSIAGDQIRIQYGTDYC